MKIPQWLASLVVGTIFALQAWSLSEIINLKVEVAKICQQLNINENENQTAQK